MKVLVVGGAGYVGGAVTDLLSLTNHSFRVYDSLLYEEAFTKPVPFTLGDIRDRERLLPHLQWADAVIWLAALVGDAACALNPETSVEMNQTAVEWLAQNFSGRIIFLSTCSVYGAAHTILDESSPTNPLSVYAVTKLLAESYLSESNAIIFRLGTLFGLSDIFSRVRFDLVVNTLTLRAHLDNKISVFGGEQFRPLLHVRDAADAIVANLTTSLTGVYNLHSENARIADLADQVAGHFPNLEIVRTPAKFEDNRNYRVSSGKAMYDFNFHPHRTVDSGIEEIKWMLADGRIRDPQNPRYLNDKFLAQYRTHLEEVAR